MTLRAPSGPEGDVPRWKAAWLESHPARGPRGEELLTFVAKLLAG